MTNYLDIDFYKGNNFIKEYNEVLKNDFSENLKEHIEGILKFNFEKKIEELKNKYNKNWTIDEKVNFFENEVFGVIERSFGKKLFIQLPSLDFRDFIKLELSEKFYNIISFIEDTGEKGGGNCRYWLVFSNELIRYISSEDKNIDYYFLLDKDKHSINYIEFKDNNGDYKRFLYDSLSNPDTKEKMGLNKINNGLYSFIPFEDNIEMIKKLKIKWINHYKDLDEYIDENEKIISKNIFGVSLKLSNGNNKFFDSKMYINRITGRENIYLIYIKKGDLEYKKEIKKEDFDNFLNLSLGNKNFNVQKFIKYIYQYTLGGDIEKINQRDINHISELLKKTTFYKSITNKLGIQKR